MLSIRYVYLNAILTFGALHTNKLAIDDMYLPIKTEIFNFISEYMNPNLQYNTNQFSLVLPQGISQLI